MPKALQCPSENSLTFWFRWTKINLYTQSYVCLFFFKKKTLLNSRKNEFNRIVCKVSKNVNTDPENHMLMQVLWKAHLFLSVLASIYTKPLRLTLTLSFQIMFQSAEIKNRIFMSDFSYTWLTKIVCQLASNVETLSYDSSCDYLMQGLSFICMTLSFLFLFCQKSAYWFTLQYLSNLFCSSYDSWSNHYFSCASSDNR